MTFEMKTAFKRLSHKCTMLILKLAYHMCAMCVMHYFKRRRLPGAWEKRVMFLIKDHGYLNGIIKRYDTFHLTGYYECIMKPTGTKVGNVIVCEAYLCENKSVQFDSSKREMCFASLFRQFTHDVLHQDISPEEVDLKIIASGFEDEHMKLFTEVMKLHQLKRAIDVYDSRICDKMFKLNKRKQ